MAQGRITTILDCIESGECDEGWRDFLSAYSRQLHSIVRQFESDDTRRQDCYEYVCACLSDDGFNRLRKFNPDGPAEFRTWLAVVASNLCRDWRRAQVGRHRVPEPVLRLSEFDQLVFDLIYRQALTQTECAQILDASHSGFRQQDLHDALARLHRALPAQSRWRRNRRNHDSPDIDPDQLQSRADGPEALCETDAEIQRLERALARLDPEQRLLLQLRYRQDLTFREIAALLGFSDPFAVRRAIDKSLKTLKKAMQL